MKAPFLISLATMLMFSCAVGESSEAENDELLLALEKETKNKTSVRVDKILVYNGDTERTSIESTELEVELEFLTKYISNFKSNGLQETREENNGVVVIEKRGANKYLSAEIESNQLRKIFISQTQNSLFRNGATQLFYSRDSAFGFHQSSQTLRFLENEIHLMGQFH